MSLHSVLLSSISGGKFIEHLRISPALLRRVEWLSGFDGLGPTGELAGSGLGDIGEARPTFEGDFAGAFLEADEAIASGPVGFGIRGVAGFDALDGEEAFFGIGVGEHGDFVVESVEVIAGPRQRRSSDWICAGFFILGPPPAAVIVVNDGRHDEGPRSVAEVADAVLDERGDVLVASDVDGAGLLDEFERLVTAGLGPTVRIKVGMEAVAAFAVEMRAAAEAGL